MGGEGRPIPGCPETTNTWTSGSLANRAALSASLYSDRTKIFRLTMFKGRDAHGVDGRDGTHKGRRYGNSFDGLVISFDRDVLDEIAEQHGGEQGIRRQL